MRNRSPIERWRQTGTPSLVPEAGRPVGFPCSVRRGRDKTRPSLPAHSLRGSPHISRRMAVTAALHSPSPALCTLTCAPTHLPPRPSACTILAYTRLCAHMFTDAGCAFSGAQVQRYGYGHRLQLHRAQKKKLSAGESSGDPAPARDRLPQVTDQTERLCTRMAGLLRGLSRGIIYESRLDRCLARQCALGANEQA